MRSKDATIEVDPLAGGRIASIVVGGLELLHQNRSALTDWGMYVMAPWAGRVRDGSFRFQGTRYRLPLTMPPHAIHGTALWSPWEVTGAGQLECRLGPPWPFGGSVRHRLRLGEASLALEITVEAGSRPMPAVAGWHPCFRRRLERGQPAEIHLPARAMLKRDPAGIPTGERVPVPSGPVDDCFEGLAWPARITWPGALELQVMSDCDYAVIYTEPEAWFGLEPQSEPPDALNHECFVAEPGRPLVIRSNWAWRQL